MDYCANTFRRELISRDGAQTISRQSHALSTRGHGNDSNGEPPLKLGTNTYDQFNSNVLLRPVEYALSSSVRVHDCADHVTAASCYSHVQRFDDQVGTHVIRNRPSQNLLRVLVLDRAQVHIAFTAGQIRDVRCPDGIESTLI